MMMIDIFNHFIPETYYRHVKELAPDNMALKAFETLPALWNLDERLRLVERFDDYRQIICLANPPLEYLAKVADTADLARRANDALADVCRRHPDRFPAFVASLPMDRPDAAVAEAERAIAELGACGVQVFTNVAGRPLSEGDYVPLFECLAGHDLPVWVHPMRTPAAADYATETASRDEVWFTFGWPYETSACMARLVYSGLFDRLPHLKIVTHHMGGMIPFFANKIALGFEQIFSGTPDRNPVAERAGLARQPVDYFRRLHADTATNGSAAALACGLDFFGIERCLFATDAPFDSEKGVGLVRDTIAAVNALDVTPADRERIFSGNAKRLLRLA